MVTLTNTPQGFTSFQLEQRKSYAFGLNLIRSYDTQIPVDLTGCVIRLVAKAPTHLGGAVILDRDATFPDRTLGLAQVTLQASDLAVDPGDYPFAVVLVTAHGYSKTLLKGELTVLENVEVESTTTTYTTVNPSTNLAIYVGEGDLVTVQVDAIDGHSLITQSLINDFEDTLAARLLSISQAVGEASASATAAQTAFLAATQRRDDAVIARDAAAASASAAAGHLANTNLRRTEAQAAADAAAVSASNAQASALTAEGAAAAGAQAGVAQGVANALANIEAAIPRTDQNETITGQWDFSNYPTVNGVPITGGGGGEGGGGGGTITSVNGQVGPAVVLTKDSLGLSKVENTSDAEKPISTPTATALASKADAAAVAEALATKAATADVNNALAAKANSSDVTTALAAKANSADVTTSLSAKLDKTALAGEVEKLIPDGADFTTGNFVTRQSDGSFGVPSAASTALDRPVPLGQLNSILDSFVPDIPPGSAFLETTSGLSLTSDTTFSALGQVAITNVKTGDIFTIDLVVVYRATAAAGLAMRFKELVGELTSRIVGGDFAANVTGFYTNPGGGSLTWDSTNGVGGTGAAKLTHTHATGATHYIWTPWVTTTAGRAWGAAASAFKTADATSRTWAIDVQWGDDTASDSQLTQGTLSGGGGALSALTTSHVRKKIENQIAPVGTTKVRARFRALNTASGMVTYADQLQLEPGTTVPDFGNSTGGYAALDVVGSYDGVPKSGTPGTGGYAFKHPVRFPAITSGNGSEFGGLGMKAAGLGTSHDAFAYFSGRVKLLGEGLTGKTIQFEVAQMLADAANPTQIVTAYANISKVGEAAAA